MIIMETCDECKGNLVRKKEDYLLLGTNLGKYEAKVCTSCGETLFDGKEFAAIEAAAKAKGIWGLARKTRVGTSGSSLDVKLPKPIAEFLNVKKGQEVLIAPVDKKRVEITIL